MNQFAPVTRPQQVKLRIEDFELLLRAGALDGYPQVELVEGVIVAMNAEFRRHGRAKNEIAFRLREALRAMNSPYVALCEPTVSFPPYSLPEPDVIVVNDEGPGDDYHHGDAVAIVIEVADSSSLHDLRYKFELYGRQGIAEYWVFELPANQVHRFWNPAQTGYKQSAVTPIGERLSSITIAELTIETANLY